MEKKQLKITGFTVKTNIDTSIEFAKEAKDEEEEKDRELFCKAIQGAANKVNENMPGALVGLVTGQFDDLIVTTCRQEANTSVMAPDIKTCPKPVGL